MANLKVTPEELMAMANQVASKAEELNNKVSQLDGVVESVSGAWTGISSNAFYNSYVEMQPALHSFSEILNQIATMAQTAAKAYDDADVEMAAAFGG